MQHSLNDRTLTLAGLFQAAGLVSRTANQGKKIDSSVETSINSLFKINSQSVEDIYNGAIHLRFGLEMIRKQMDSKSELKDIATTRYVITLLYLEKKLSKNPEMLKTLEQGLDVAQSQADYFSPCHENVIGGLADLYQKTISTLNPKVMVTGDQTFLRDTDNANLVRTLLLTGIRSAMAWRQCGGSRLQLLFKRRALHAEAGRILDNLPGINTLV
ncbi:MAG: high frequency lysogenization protein HflD [Gammaproteobacteria bacterium]|nr:high frequency lysogenization protein HflD [Gammaproteobacteria bacterium]